MKRLFLRHIVSRLDAAAGRAWQEAEVDLASELEDVAGWKRWSVVLQYLWSFCRIATVAVVRSETADRFGLYSDALRRSSPVLTGPSARFTAVGLISLLFPLLAGEELPTRVLPLAALALAHMLPVVWFGSMTVWSSNQTGDWDRLPALVRLRAAVALALIACWLQLVALPVLTRLLSGELLSTPSGIRAAHARTLFENVELIIRFLGSGDTRFAVVVAGDIVASVVPALALAAVVFIPVVAREYTSTRTSLLSRSIAAVVLVLLFVLEVQAFPSRHRWSGEALLTLSSALLTALLYLNGRGAVLVARAWSAGLPGTDSEANS